MKHVLRVIDGPLAGEVLVLDGRATLGRAADCDLQLLHNGVSRHHARLRLHDTGLVLTDLSSDNGTYVNGHRVQRCVLESGDTVRVMNSLLRYEFTEVDLTAEAGHRAKVTSGESLRRTGPFSVAPTVDPGPSKIGPSKIGPSKIGPDVVNTDPGRSAPSPLEPSVAYRAGESGVRRRSVQPSGLGRRLQVQPPIAADLPSLLAPDEAVLSELAESPADLDEHPSQRATAPATNTPLWPHMLPVAESPPVTTGSGAFKRPVAPPSTRRGDTPGSLRLPIESSDEAIFRSPTTGRFGTGELLAAHLEAEAEHAVPPAARGGSVALDYPSTPAYGAAVREARTPTPQETPMPEAWVSSDLRAELDVQPRGAAPLLDGRAAPRAVHNSVDSVGTGAAKFAARSGSPRGAPVAETGEYPPPRVPRTGEYGALPEGAGPIAAPNDGEKPADVPIEVSTSSGQDSVSPGDSDGRLALVAVLQYRDFRLRTLRGGTLTQVEQKQFGRLDRNLQRIVAAGGTLEALRRFTRFTCEFPGELTHPATTALSTMPIAVYDIGAGGAMLDVGTTRLEVGNVAWLSIDLGGLAEVPMRGAHRVVFKARVVWVENARLGLAFAGAPKYDVAPGFL